MKQNMVTRLVSYFSLSLVLFSLVIGGVFFTLFKTHTIAIEKADLKARALAMASTLATLINEEGEASVTPYGNGNGRGLSNMGMNTNMGMVMEGQRGAMGYLRFLDDIAMADVWIVDENLNLLMMESPGSIQYNYGDLPIDAEAVVREVFQGKTTYSQGFSDLLEKPTLTIGTPIMVNDRVAGALLLHSPVEGTEEALQQGYRILVVSILTGLILAILLSLALAVSFTKPLEKMKRTAKLLAEGNYSVQTGVSEKGEVGELASSIDLLSEKLEEARQERENLETLRHEFTANISHELRTPVTVMRGSLEALRDGMISEEQIPTYYDQMFRESLFLQRLIEDLLELSRLQNASFSIEKEEVNVIEILEDVVRSAKQIAKNKSIEICFEKDTGSFRFQGDYGRLRQMFFIIMDNGIKFSEKNQKLRINWEGKVLTISDEGIGIEREELAHIFERFRKARSEENKNGTGLGLAIAKQIADRHGIKISVASEVGVGTSFSFFFEPEGSGSEQKNYYS